MKISIDTNLKVCVLLSVISAGIIIKLLENHKIDDEPVKQTYVPTFNFNNPALSGTVTVSGTAFR